MDWQKKAQNEFVLYENKKAIGLKPAAMRGVNQLMVIRKLCIWGYS